MADRPPRGPNYQDVLDAPEGTTAEILAGELHVSPRPATAHLYAEGEIAAALGNPFMRGRGGPGGWWILAEPELHLGRVEPTSVVASPDLAGWRRERMPTLPDVPALTLPPDWICEVLSPGGANMRRDRVHKPLEYALAGIPWLWFVDPRDHLLEVRLLDAGAYTVVQTFVGEGRVRARPFEAIEVDLSDWWLRTA